MLKANPQWQPKRNPGYENRLAFSELAMLTVLSSAAHDSVNKRERYGLASITRR